MEAVSGVAVMAFAVALNSDGTNAIKNADSIESSGGVSVGPHAASDTDGSISAEALQRALVAMRANRFVPKRLRIALQLAGHVVAPTTEEDGSTDLGSKTAPQQLARTLSSRTVSTASGTGTFSRTSTSSSADGSVTSSVRSVHFSDADEVVAIPWLPWEDRGSQWLSLAERRQDRFCLKVHRSCKRPCWCVEGDGVCTSGGVLASETAIGLVVVFGAWRHSCGIPATVSLRVMNRGLDWSRR